MTGGGGKRPDELEAQGLVVDNHDFQRHKVCLGAWFFSWWSRDDPLRKNTPEESRVVTHTPRDVQRVKAHAQGKGAILVDPQGNYLPRRFALPPRSRNGTGRRSNNRTKCCSRPRRGLPAHLRPGIPTGNQF